MLSERDLSAATDERRFARGEQYVRYVRGLQVGDQVALASIQGQRVYEVQLDWSRPALRGRCTCTDHADGAFCKHLVAVGLAVIDLRGPDPAPGADAVAGYLDGLDRDELLAIVRELVVEDGEARHRVLERAAAAGEASVLDPAELTAEVTRALAVRGTVDYRRSFDVAADAQALLDRLERLLDAGAAEAVQPALLRALTRMRRLTGRADDSGGVLGDATQRSLDLYARSCREGTPDPVPLARWLVKFRQESPGWPAVSLVDFAPVFDEQAMRTYRSAVARWDASLQGVDHISRSEVDEALVELADAAGDLDAAVAVLVRDAGHEAYADVVRRLVAADRHREALGWLDRAVTADRIGVRDERTNPYWLAPAEAASLYRQGGRAEDALEVLRRAFARTPGVRSWVALLRLAAELGREPEERAWAVAQAERLAAAPYSSGASLVEIQLEEGRVDEAWRTAERFGAGHAWESLARAGAGGRPAAAAELYRPVVENLLVHADTTKYASAAKALATMRDLYAAAGEPEVFAGYLGELRQRYARRTSFLAALDRRQLR